ncbi:MAG: CoA transferase [Pseudomonadota bacterium]|nr:CoA transferase [Pseudomonadota bacterium]MEC8199768.1 CoA transferase [Pseudomonadota bacterium]MEC8370115.1 CoA transferase [Pseudomonadota bacterium]MEC8698138.1 CoA transferase [Pseudomonadota bacterium]MED5575160.1 CoA transferase [Pseudomonadota bacterium]
MGYDAPFEGLKVVDISQGVSGPYAGMLMAQYGASVVKVEPLEGEWGRFISRDYDKHSAFSVTTNLGKRSLALDLKSEEGKEALRKLINDADVFIENFRPGVTDRLGFSYDEVSRISPKAIYLSVSGFGNGGPMRERPAMDPVLQAFSGLMSVNMGEDGIPHRVGVVICDMATALYGFQALSTALYARRDEEKGCLIETNLMQGAACLSAIRMMMVSLERGAYVVGRVPAGVFEAADGYLTILMYRDEEFPKLCDLLDLPELGANQQFATNAQRVEYEAEIMPAIRDAFKRKPLSELTVKLTEARILHERVNDFIEFIDHPQVRETGLISWLDHSGVGRVPVPNIPGLKPFDVVNAKSPTIGQHSREILTELGYCESEISDYAARKITLA